MFKKYSLIGLVLLATSQSFGMGYFARFSRWIAPTTAASGIAAVVANNKLANTDGIPDYPSQREYPIAGEKVAEIFRRCGLPAEACKDDQGGYSRCSRISNHRESILYDYDVSSLFLPEVKKAPKTERGLAMADLYTKMICVDNEILRERYAPELADRIIKDREEDLSKTNFFDMYSSELPKLRRAGYNSNKVIGYLSTLQGISAFGSRLPKHPDKATYATDSLYFKCLKDRAIKAAEQHQQDSMLKTPILNRDDLRDCGEEASGKMMSQSAFKAALKAESHSKKIAQAAQLKKTLDDEWRAQRVALKKERRQYLENQARIVEETSRLF